MKENLEYNNKTNKNNNDKLISLFEQSWEYIRHTQNMFWQSFTALFTVIAALLIISLDKDITIKLISNISALVLSLMGFCVSNRIITILREHFATINRTRDKLGLDSIPELILPRWNKKGPEEFHMTDKEILHVFIANQMYIAIFSSFVGYSIFLITTNHFPLKISFILTIITAIISGMSLEAYACNKVYEYPS